GYKRQVEPDLFSSFVGEEKKEEVEPAVSKDFVLTAEVIDNQLVDPMIGMENSSPYDFIPAKNA
ncbi:hypothetical protein, partial [Enterococcus faecium]|uniref:hypothetical protein n=1 Tax=Enterococcus faecium TaxID=1352 RepID=UPI000E16658D